MGRPAMLRSARSRGFTLIEVLATVTILALAGGVLVVRLGGASATTQLRAAVAQWQDLDHRARVAARRLGAVELSLDATGRTLRVHGLGADEEMLLSADLPRGAFATLEPREPGALVIDARGRGDDYTVRITSSNGSVRAWRVLGLTGAVMEEARP